MAFSSFNFGIRDYSLSLAVERDKIMNFLLPSITREELNIFGSPLPHAGEGLG